MSLQVAGFPVGPLQANCYILSDDALGAACVVVDPGGEGERIVEVLGQQGLRCTQIWITHAHLDHVGGVAVLKRAFPAAPIRLHVDDFPLWERASQQGRAWGIEIEQPPLVDLSWVDGDTVDFGEHRFTVHHLPGHAPGHVALVGRDDAFVGDVIFRGSIGRTDLPGSNPTLMQHSLQRIANWPTTLTLYPGHGPISTVGRELRENPFLAGLARPLGAR